MYTQIINLNTYWENYYYIIQKEISSVEHLYGDEIRDVVI